MAARRRRTKLSARDRKFIQTCAAARYSRQSTLKALRAFRRRRGYATRKDYVYTVYSAALKRKHVRKARRTVYDTMKLKGYSAKGRRERMLDLINKAESKRSWIELLDQIDFYG